MHTPSIIVLASLALSSPAAAEKVGVVVTGEATLQPQLAAQLENWLRDRGRIVVPGPLEPDAVSTLIDCFVLEDLGCARGVVDARSKSRAVVFARIESAPSEGGTRDISVTAHWFQKERDALAERRVCSRCTEQRLRETVDELIAALVHEPPLPHAPAPLAPPRRDPAPAAATEPSSVRRLALGLTGAGAAGLIAGAILVAIDEDPDPVGPQQPRYRDTATGGALVGLAGAAALGAGIYLWLRPAASSAPVAAASGDGAVVGWTGRF